MNKVEKKEKEFDTAKVFREVKEKIAKATKGTTFAEKLGQKIPNCS